MSKKKYTVGLMSLVVLTAGSLSLTAQQARGPARTTVLMSGTYELDGTRGGDPETAARMATRSLPPGQRDRAYQSLLSRLEPPQTLSIDRNERMITIASSRGPRSVFDADGRTQSERGQNGRLVTTRADIIGNQVRVTTSSGNRGSDFYVTFEALNNGTALLVTRRLDDDGLARPVTIQSYYRRVASAPRWDVYDAGPDYGAGRFGLASDADVIVANGMRLMATLDTPLSMRTSRSGEPFTMTVFSPAQFRGARIDGVMSRVNGYRDTGAGTDIRFDFQAIELDGRSSDFDAMLNTIRLSDGAILRLNEGEVPEVDRGSQTVQNGAIGAAVGAIIGAMAGGGKGAAIGAAVGGTGGVILSQGHEQLDLPRGTDVTLTALTSYRPR